MAQINILAGKMNSGKTSKMIEIYEKLKKGDGFVSIKTMYKDKVYGYEILKLSSNEKMQFILNEQYIGDKWQEIFKIGSYSFSKQAMQFIEKEIEKMISCKITPIFLDEIGNLELQDKGFSNILNKLVKSESEIYITIREDLVKSIIKKYMGETKICMI